MALDLSTEGPLHYAGTSVLMAWALWTLPQRSRPEGGRDVSFRTAVQRAFANPVLGIVIVGSLAFALLVAPIEQLAPGATARALT